jgi:hypothetical protein
MAVRYAGSNVGVFTAGGIALVGSGYSFTYEANNDVADAGLVQRLGKHNQPVKQNGRLSVQRNGVVSGSTRTSHLNVTAFTIGGANFLNVLKSYTLAGSFEHRMQAGIGEKYAKPQVVAKDYQITATLDVQAVDSYTLADLIGGADFSDVDQAVSVTIEGVAITVPMNLNTFALNVSRYELQEMVLTFQGADAGAGSYPTAPTGTSSLLEKALNAPTTEVNVTFQNALSGDANGVNVSAAAVFESFEIQTQDGQLVNETYNFLTYGTITTGASS